jgi:glycyl-tRNA synthetase
MQNFQSFVFSLIEYWGRFGCLWTQPYDSAMGAGTFHPHTFLKGLGPEPWRSVYVQPCRRPVDGRYGESPYRFQHYYQLQVFLKPAPADIVDVFLQSLEHIGIRLHENDISLLEDDWKGPTLGAWGLGWEVRANGQEVTQFTYFQQLGGIDLDVISGEITYGLERLYMYATGLKSALDIPYNEHFSYGDIFKQNEVEFSHFNFKSADTDLLFSTFAQCESKVKDLCEKNLVLPAYDYVLQASHAFNLLDARGSISVSERQRYIGRVRDCARLCANTYRAEREKLGFPMMSRLSSDPRIPFVARTTSKPTGAADRSTVSGVPQQSSTCDFCIELGVEEIPPAFQTSAQEKLQIEFERWLSGMSERFASDTSMVSALNKIEFQVLVAARRIALVCQNLPRLEPNVAREVWGPAKRIAQTATGEFSPAALGFARKLGVSAEELTWKERADGVFLYAQKMEPGRELPKCLAQDFIQWCLNVECGLKMKWIMEDSQSAFVRPVRWICALADDEIVPAEAFGLSSSNLTFGQRILHPKPIHLDHARNYVERIRSLDVEPDRSARIAHIRQRASELALSVGGGIPDGLDSLVEKVAGLSECPQVFLGSIPEKYMRLPERLITSVLREHMNYLSVVQPNSNQAMPYYVGVAGYPCANLEGMIEATGVVVSGRLDDGAFYFDEDLKTPLHELYEKLASQLFQQGMGTLRDKSARVASLSKHLAQLAFPDNPALHIAAETAGLYCKADLKSGCVQEFPDEMQGLMGGILVREQNLFGANSAVISGAISEHYEPSTAYAALPASPVGRILSLADKLDSLVVLIGHGTDVKGNKDPFGLRRLGLAVLRLMGSDGEEAAVVLSLAEGIRLAVENCRSAGMELSSDVHEKVFSFAVARLRAAWRTQFDPGAVEAVTARLQQQTVSASRDWVKATSQALVREGQEPPALALAIVPYKRCRTLTEELMSGGSFPNVKPDAFQEDGEKELYDQLVFAESRCRELLELNDCERYLGVLAELRHPMAKFFDSVLVNAPDALVKQNRLALLLRVRQLYDSVADFSLVQVAGNG